MSDTNTDEQEDEFPYPTSTTSKSTSTMSAENLIEDKHQAITNEYKQLKYKAEHKLPTHIAATLFTKVILPTFITIFLFHAFNPLIITAPAVIFWIFQLYAPTKYKESLKNGYQIDPDNANESDTHTPQTTARPTLAALTRTPHPPHFHTLHIPCTLTSHTLRTPSLRSGLN